MQRIEELIKEKLAQIIQEEMTDPRIGFATVSRVKVSRDLRQALVSVSFLEDNEERIREALDALAHARGFLRKELGTRITLKYLPDLKFIHDGSAAYASHIQVLLNEAQIAPPPDEGEEDDEGLDS